MLTQRMTQRIAQNHKEMQQIIYEEVLNSGVSAVIEMLENTKQLLFNTIPDSLIREQEVSFLDGILFGLKFREIVIIDKETGEILE